MGAIGYVLSSIGMLGFLVCYILVLVQIFQRGQTGLGITFIVLALCCGLGGIIEFIYGWVKATPWGIQNIMLVWTASLVLMIIGGAINPAPFQQFQQLPGWPGR
jgi:hypothetical protein